MTGPEKRLIFLLNLGQRAVERWIEGQADDTLALSAPQAGTLFFLSRNDGALIGEVAQALHIGASAMSGLANRLAIAGLVERRRDEVDGRAIRLHLTSDGREAGQRAKTVLATLNNRLSDGFTPAEMDVVGRWLGALQDKFRAPGEPLER
ncbi:MarR family winged helix-turn-helix transcriptional regulator [Rhizobacter sp. Root1221]|uniref:MarR family winged helix-turn-helix transcriptional regulator n=1 Tax=Rhizobacter sp. Root1221 TaxID=1736433 RepID=UPI0007004FD1|nr:MarR family transcriptional regulator [Rhizobacter sp. Root1221]KQW01205.1 MarR family transcriptional regulator [Rhizobacter sp. Root1221]